MIIDVIVAICNNLMIRLDSRKHVFFLNEDSFFFFGTFNSILNQKNFVRFGLENEWKNSSKQFESKI